MSDQSLVIIGETGATYQISSISDLKLVCDNYVNLLGITLNDISIINNKEQDFIYFTNNKLEFFPDSKYFIFSKRYNIKLLQAFYNYQSKNNTDIISSNVNININIPDITKILIVLEHNKDLLTCSIDEIKSSYEKMNEYYNQYNNIYTNFYANINLVNKIKEYYKYQNEAVEMLNNVSLVKFEKCFNGYQNFMKESEISKNKNDKILKNYSDNIDRLKKIILPDSFIKYIQKKKKSTNIKYLIDIYFKENDMNIWRDNCQNKQECLVNKVKAKEKILQKEKAQISKDSNTFVTPLKTGWNFYLSEYEKLYNERNSYMISILNEINTDFILFNNIISQMKEIFESNLMNSNPNYINTIKDSCSKILSFKEKYSDITKLSSLSNYLQPFNDYINKMKNSIDYISKKINDYFINVRAVKNILEKLNDKVMGYSKAVKNIEEDFKFLETPGNFINSYENTFSELKRRNMFYFEMEEELIKIKAIIKNENYLRKKFIEDNKKYLTPDFIKLFKLENLVLFNYELKSNNEQFELKTIFSEENNFQDTNADTHLENDNICENYENTGKFNESNITINKNKKIIQNLMIQINELDMKCKVKEKELSEVKNKYTHIENSFSELNKNMNNIYISFDEISDSFNNELSFKERQIEDLTKNLKNLNNNINQTNDINFIQNCPLCKERTSNWKGYNNIENVFQEMKQEINKYKKQINDLDINYKKLMYNTISMKKCFFNHMNMVVTRKNLEVTKFKEKQEEKVMYMEEILSAEKIFNKNSIKEEMSKLNYKIKEYATTISNNNETINNYEKINNELKSKELFLERELQIHKQNNEKLTDNNIELTNELRQNHKDISNYSKLLEQSKKEHVESIKLLNSTHQANIDSLKDKLNELSEKIKDKETEDGKKYQQYLTMKEQYTQIIQENEFQKEKINELSLELQGKNKKIDELMQTQELRSIKGTTNDITLSAIDDDIIYYKKIEKNLRCIFVPFYQNIFVCINLSDDLIDEMGENEIYPLTNYECKYILDLNSFDENLSKIIVDNSLIVIGKVSKMTELEQNKNKFYNLPDDKQFILVTLGKVDYVIGFPENELIFNNYIN